MQARRNLMTSYYQPAVSMINSTGSLLNSTYSSVTGIGKYVAGAANGVSGAVGGAMAGAEVAATVDGFVGKKNDL